MTGENDPIVVTGAAGLIGFHVTTRLLQLGRRRCRRRQSQCLLRSGPHSSVYATGLRLFTVYGPWGRPDMALWLFTEAILQGKPIRLFNNGRMKRDFTYVDDVTEAIVRLVDRPATPDAKWSGSAPNPATSFAPWRVYNIGNHTPVEVTEVVRLIEEQTGCKAIQENLPIQPGDVPETCADVGDLEAAAGFRPKTPIAEGVRRFAAWYRGYVAQSDPVR
jgi:UDP-glucuronate 4-epimerase